jgi:hypothetical protein
MVNQELWTLLGGSRDERQERPQPPPGQVRPPDQHGQLSTSNAPISLASWNAAATRPHPQRSDAKTVQIEVWQGPPGQAKRKVEWTAPATDAPNELAFRTSEGQELELRIRNQTDELLAVIVQIDGVNQFGCNIALPSQSHYWFCEARHTIAIDQWVAAPVRPAAPQQVPAFLDLPGQQLVVINAPHSVAGQQNYWDNLGEIRVLVYGTRKVAPGRAANGPQGGLGIGAGTAATRRHRVIEGMAINLQRSLSTNVIRYAAE